MNLLVMTAEIVAAYVSQNEVDAAELGKLIVDVHTTILALMGGAAGLPAVLGQAAERRTEETVSDAYLVCLEDGARVRVLKRYLRRFGLSPDEYRRKWNLPDDYPMTAPAYSRLRRRVAKQIGLGTTAMRERTAG